MVSEAFCSFLEELSPQTRLREDLQTAALETLPPTLETYGGASGEGERIRFLLAAPLSQLEEGKSTLGSSRKATWTAHSSRGVFWPDFPTGGRNSTPAPLVWPYFLLCWAVVTLLWTEPQWLVPRSRAGWLPCSRDALICCK